MVVMLINYQHLDLQIIETLKQTQINLSKPNKLNMSLYVQKPKNVDVSKVTFSEPNVNKYGGKSLWVNYKSNEGRSEKFTVQTGKMYLSFGINLYQNDDGSQDVSMNLSFRGCREEGTKMHQTFMMFHNLDERMIKESIKNSLAWHTKKKMSEEATRAIYSPQIKVSMDKETGEPSTKYDPTLRVKVPWRSGPCPTNMFFNGRTREQIIFENVEDLQDMIHKGSEVQVLVQCSSVWFASGKFGLSWRIKQCLIFPVEKTSGFAFMPDSDDEEEYEQTNYGTTEEIVEKKPECLLDGDGDESDDDEDPFANHVDDTEESEEEPPQVVSKSKKKRKTKSKSKSKSK